MATEQTKDMRDMLNFISKWKSIANKYVAYFCAHFVKCISITLLHAFRRAFKNRMELLVWMIYKYIYLIAIYFNTQVILHGYLFNMRYFRAAAGPGNNCIAFHKIVAYFRAAIEILLHFLRHAK